MTDKQRLIDANASLFRHSAKISYISMVSLIMGFAHGVSITDAARKAEVHRVSPYLKDEDDKAQMEEAAEALFNCHGNIGCQKRYTAGRRKERVCRACPVKTYVARHDAEPEYAAALVELVDNLREFYNLLGWKESAKSGNNQRAIFDKRFLHYEVYSTAVTNSTFDDNGKVTSEEDDFLSIHHLAKELMENLKEEPLK